MIQYKSEYMISVERQMEADRERRRMIKLKQLNEAGIKDAIEYITSELSVRLACMNLYTHSEVDKILMYLKRMYGNKYKYTEKRMIELIQMYPVLGNNIPDKYKTSAVELAAKLL